MEKYKLYSVVFDKIRVDQFYFELLLKIRNNKEIILKLHADRSLFLGENEILKVVSQE